MEYTCKANLDYDGRVVVDIGDGNPGRDGLDIVEAFAFNGQDYPNFGNYAHLVDAIAEAMSAAQDPTPRQRKIIEGALEHIARMRM